MLYPIFLIGLCAFLFSLVLTPACRDLFRRLGIVDQPDHARKLHHTPVPLMGGVPIALAYVASWSLLALFPSAASPHLARVLRALPACLVILGVGILDDILHIKPWQKLFGQTIGALLAYWAGIQVLTIGGYDIGWYRVPSLLLTVVWLLACTNAFNLIDGMDGLAAGLGLFATTTMLISALTGHNIILAAVTAPLVGALLGFLRYNFTPASIFLGDSGSLIIGFLLGCFGVIYSQKATTILGMTAPLLALGIPILDTGLSIVRRFLRHQPIFDADRDHIHHRLLKRGFTQRHAALLLYGVAGIGATFSLLLQKIPNNRLAGAVVLLFCAAAWLGIQHLGYAEFRTARHMLLAGTFQQAVGAQIRLRSFELDLSASKSVEECWECILDASRTFDFVEVRLSIAGTVYQKRLRDADDDLCWCLRVPLPPNGYINFTRPHESLVFSVGVAPFIDVVRKIMSAKCQEFGTATPPEILAAGSRFDG